MRSKKVNFIKNQVADIADKIDGLDYHTKLDPGDTSSTAQEFHQAAGGGEGSRNPVCRSVQCIG